MKSYKKNPYIRQEYSDKRLSNKRIRNSNIEYSLRGSQYKKIASDWSHYKYRWTLDDAIRGYKKSKAFPTLNSWIEYWKRCCLRK